MFQYRFKNPLTSFLLASFIVLIPSSVLKADEAELAKKVIYIGQPDGFFNVGIFDFQENIIHRWKGVRLPREELPETGPLQHVLIYEHKKEPDREKLLQKKIQKLKKEGKWTRQKKWNLQLPRRYSRPHGKPDYPIKDVDPPLAALRRNGNIHLGFKFQWRFYSVVSRKPSEIRSLVKLTRVPPDRIRTVYHVTCPSHRIDEFRDLGVDIQQPDKVHAPKKQDPLKKIVDNKQSLDSFERYEVYRELIRAYREAKDEQNNKKANRILSVLERRVSEEKAYAHFVKLDRFLKKEKKEYASSKRRYRLLKRHAQNMEEHYRQNNSDNKVDTSQSYIHQELMKLSKKSQQTSD